MSFTLLGILNAQAAGAGGAGAYDLLETTILTTDTASVSFTGLDTYSDYKHLQLRMVVRGSRSANDESLRVRANSDTGSNYARHTLVGEGGAVSSVAQTSQTNIVLGGVVANNATANTFAGVVTDILDFSSTTKNTTFRTLSGLASTTSQVSLSSGLYNSTAALTALELFPSTGPNFITGSRFSLYGIRG